MIDAIQDCGAAGYGSPFLYPQSSRIRTSYFLLFF